MRNTEIDLAQPFERVLATALSLPTGCSDAATDRLSNKTEVKQVIRGLYEAANGRHVETNIGLIVIVPPAAAFLKTRPFQVATQTELLIEAATRLIGGSAIVAGRRRIASKVDRIERDQPGRRDHAAKANGSDERSTRRPMVKRTRISLVL